MFNTEDITRTLTMVVPAVNLISNHKARKIIGTGIGVLTTGIGIYNTVQIIIPVKESLFLDEDCKKEFMLNYIEERVENAT